MGSLAPNLIWVLDYRFFVSLVLLTLVIVVVRRKYWWLFVFVGLWPLIVVLFYVPRFLYRHRSPKLAMAVVQVAFGFIRGLRLSIVLFAATSVATAGILLANQPWFLVACLVMLFAAWSIFLVRLVRYSITPGAFLTGQRKLVSRVFDSRITDSMIMLEDKHKDPAGPAFTAEETSTVLTRLSTGLALARGSQMWATKLEEYRRGPATLLFGCLAVAAMYLQSVFTFTLINLGIYKLDAAEYVTAYPPSLATFVHYALASSAYGEISALAPRGFVAVAASAVMGLTTALVLFVFVVALIMGYRQSRTDQLATTAIAEMRASADDLEARISREYGLDADTLRTRLVQLGGGIVSLLPFLFPRAAPPSA